MKISKRRGVTNLKYSKDERLEIGRRIYVGELTTSMAANEYDINYYTAREYLRAYKAEINVAIPKSQRPEGKKKEKEDAVLARASYEEMTKEELIDELIRARINEERAKKGYTVKGDGAGKEFIPIDKKNTK